ncbi:hypothetical protein [[Clostridium] colinum]|uniref:hypothetical protein n=1 Tax=[Clostridium] colinum TaxID=36835 RepID=UPI00202410E6|nr:hypothetical protein [[Clostridium] colinum]
MKNNNYKDINFFKPKINVNIENDKIFTYKKLLKRSLKIYIIVFFVMILYFLISSIIVNIKYNLVEQNIKNIQDNTSISDNFKNEIKESNMLSEIFNIYQQNNIVSSDILNKIEKIKFEQIHINEINWSINNIKLNCYSDSEKDAIIFVNKLREEEKFKDVVYNGGLLSTIDNSFKFEINIII